SLIDQLIRWRSAKPRLTILMVRGNHDDAAGDPPEALNIRCVGPVWEEAGLTFRHAPPSQPADFVMAGHVHPAVWLHGPAGASVRLACFYFGRRLALVPAFGLFTGMRAIRPGRGDRVYAVTPDGQQVMQVHPRPASTARTSTQALPSAGPSSHPLLAAGASSQPPRCAAASAATARRRGTPGPAASRRS